MQNLTFQPLSMDLTIDTRTVDLAVQSADFSATEWQVTVTSEKARRIFSGITSFGVTKSQLPAFAVEMREKYDLLVG